MTDRTLICRCEEVQIAEIAAAIQLGALTVDDVKRRTRVGMGACQGIFCIPAVAAMVAEGTGTPITELAPMTARPPVRSIPLEAMAALRNGANELVERAATPAGGAACRVSHPCRLSGPAS